MGHCIGMDVHERPFISEEDATPLEVGMTFTDEPSIMWHGKVGVRTENIGVCEGKGGRKLNSYPIDLVASACGVTRARRESRRRPFGISKFVQPARRAPSDRSL